MNNQELEQLFRCDKSEFLVKGNRIDFDSLFMKHNHRMSRRKKRTSLIPQFLSAACALVAFSGVGIYVINEPHRMKSTIATTTAANQLSQSNVEKMITWADKYQYAFDVYIPTGGLGKKAYVVSMTGQPSFTLFSPEYNAFYSISEFKSISYADSILNLGTKHWTTVKDSTGLQYHMTIINSTSREYYFEQGSTTIVIQMNYKQGAYPGFPSGLKFVNLSEM